MASNPWQDYMNALNTKAYPGSSGYWGDLGGDQQGYREGMGYPGDRAKAGYANAAGVQAGGTVGGLQGSRYRTSTRSTGAGANSLYNPLQITKSPGLAAGANSLLEEFNAGTKDIPGFDDLLKGMGTATSDINSAYRAQKDSLDIGQYSSDQRAKDAAAAALTSGYASRLGNLSDQYASSDATYGKQLQDIIARAYGGLGQYDSAANAIGDEQTNQLMSQISRYKIAGGNLGVGSDELRKIARGVGDIRLPLEQQKIAQRYNLLQNLELPADREIASRNAARITGFDAPIAQNIYGAQQGDIARSKATESQLQQLQMSVANMGMADAQAYLQSLSIPADLIQSILQKHDQTLRGRIGNLSGIGSVEDQAYYRGLNYTPGVNLSQPNYFPTNTAAYPDIGAASRYRATGTGTNGATSANPTIPVTNGVATLPNDYTWGRNPAQQFDFQRVQNYYDNGGPAPVSRYNPVAPMYRDGSGSGVGYAGNYDNLTFANQPYFDPNE